jgi:hypothetical protein
MPADSYAWVQSYNLYKATWGWGISTKARATKKVRELVSALFPRF